MRIIYLECKMGAAGDMLMGALYDLLPKDKQQAFLKKMQRLGLPGVTVHAEDREKCGIHGVHMSVQADGEEEGTMVRAGHTHADAHHHEHHHEHHHDHHHHHSSMKEIRDLLAHMEVSQAVKHQATAVYTLIAEAESRAHQMPVEQIHFHEVGSLDAVADVVGNCLLLEMLNVERIVASPVHVGSGTVHCAHGILPVPAPATADLLRGIPIYGGEIAGELCTPTGAALLRYFVDAFEPMPMMTVEKTGYGMGNKDFVQANCLRAMLGEMAVCGMADDQTTTAMGNAARISEIACNLDDMTGEEIGFAVETLMAAGALDVFTQPITMKKSRPAVMLSVLTRPADEARMIDLLFTHTRTIGLRIYDCRRRELPRRIERKETPLGPVRVKVSGGSACEEDEEKNENAVNGYLRRKVEYEDLARLARENGLSLDAVRRQIGE